MPKTLIEIRNCLISDVSNMMDELENGTLTSDGLLSYFTEIMEDAGIDTDVIIGVLEKPCFGKAGQEEAHGVKVRWGY
jgi:hypothetical protein